jgi:hypothetical protein
MATWELFRDGTKEQDLINVQYIDSANPFGDYIIAQVEDNLGQKFEKFEYATEVEVTVTPEGGSQISKFTGFVVERRENDQQGQDVLEVEAYSFDQFLRQNDVSNDQSGKVISDAIEDIVKTDTPVSFNTAKVNVVDDVELRRSLQDERVETALQILSFESGNEGFGVDDSLEFFFRPRERDTIARGVDNTEWFNYDIPERGKEAVNEVEVRFDNGDRSVVVDNPGQKLEIQNSLNLPDPATQRARIARPEITNAQDAESEGRRFLKLKNVTLTGTITTFGLFEAEPLDTIDVEIIPRGIDSEFVVTQVEYDWGRDETTLTIVENRGFNEDLFVRLSEKTERIDLRETEPQAVEDRIISSDVAADVTTEITAATQTGKTPTSTTTNDAVDKIVSGWGDEGNPTITQIVVGDEATELSRSDSDLENQIDSESVSESSPIFNTVEYSANVLRTDVQEIGLKDASGTLISRGIFDSPANISGTVEVIISVSDATEANGVVTNFGQNTIRDIIADNSPNTPTRYAFGDNQSQPSETDLALTNELTNTKLDRTQLQNIDTTEEFESALSPIPDDSPLTIDQVNGAVTAVPITQFTQAENVPASNQQGNLISDSSLANDSGVELTSIGDFVEFEFTVNHEIPAGELELGTFSDFDGWTGETGYFFNGDQYFAESLDNFTDGPVNAGASSVNVNSSALPKGSTHTFRVEILSGTSLQQNPSGNQTVDLLYATDVRSEFNITSTEPSGGYNGQNYKFPELFPDVITVEFPQERTRRKITELELFQTWDDTSEDAEVQLNIGNRTKTVFNPTRNASGNIRETLTLQPSTQPSRTVSADIELSRYDTGNGSFPLKGDDMQRMSFHILDANPDAVTRSDIGEATVRTLFKSGTVSGTLRESGQKSGPDLLTHSIFADVDPGDDNIIAAEQIKFIPK